MGFNQQNGEVVTWPFGDASVAPLTTSGDQVVDVANNMTIVDGASVAASGDRTLNLTLASVLGAGARLVLKHKATATEKLTLGEGIKGVEITGVAGKTIVAEFIYDGTAFLQVSKNQID